MPKQLCGPDEGSQEEGQQRAGRGLQAGGGGGGRLRPAPKRLRGEGRDRRTRRGDRRATGSDMTVHSEPAHTLPTPLAVCRDSHGQLLLRSGVETAAQVPSADSRLRHCHFVGVPEWQREA